MPRNNPQRSVVTFDETNGAVSVCRESAHHFVARVSALRTQKPASLNGDGQDAAGYSSDRAAIYSAVYNQKKSKNVLFDIVRYIVVGLCNR
jgi:hypothetical protein